MKDVLETILPHARESQHEYYIEQHVQTLECDEYTAQMADEYLDLFGYKYAIPKVATGLIR